MKQPSVSEIKTWTFHIHMGMRGLFELVCKVNTHTTFGVVLWIYPDGDAVLKVMKNYTRHGKEDVVYQKYLMAELPDGFLDETTFKQAMVDIRAARHVLEECLENLGARKDVEASA